MATSDPPHQPRRSGSPKRRAAAAAPPLRDETIVPGLEEVGPRRPETWAESWAAIKAGFDTTVQLVAAAALVVPWVLGPAIAQDARGELISAALFCWPVTIGTAAAIIVARETNGMNPLAALGFFIGLAALAVIGAGLSGVEINVPSTTPQNFPAAVLREFERAYGQATVFLAIIAGVFLGWVWVTRIRYHLGASA